MNRILQFLGTASITAFLAQSEARVTVQIYNTAKLPERIVSGAEAQADWMFQKAGIEVTWVNCPPVERERGADQVCKQYADPGLFVFSIVEEAPDAAIHDCTLGFALPFAGSGNHAAALSPKIAGLADQYRLDFHIVLGHVIAHELGHLLFRSTAHGDGIMRSSWNENDVMRMRQKRLWFTSEQVKQLRNGLGARC